VPETFELNLYFQMLVSVLRLERVPTLKEMATAAHLEAMPYGLLG
jgi:tryptophanyl-tRNA synthetase